MPAPAITPSVRYVRYGLTRVVFAPAVANILSPTRAEINAGTDLSGEVESVNGFQVTSNFIDTPDLLNVFTGKLAARTTADDSSITMYASSNSIDVRALLPRGTTGFLIWFDEGDVAGRKADCYPITVGSIPKDRDLEAAGRIVVNVAITRTPTENFTVPA
ncbi:MAG TPA: hypothetical protein VIV12_14730 [Streptosporangiaceae bacterium]